MKKVLFKDQVGEFDRLFKLNSFSFYLEKNLCLLVIINLHLYVR